MSHGVLCLAFSRDSRTLAAGSEILDDKQLPIRGELKLWDVAARKLKKDLLGHSDAVTGVAFAQGSDLLASCSSDGTACLWNRATGKPSAVLRGKTGALRSLAFTPDGRLLATVGQEISVWDVAARRRIDRLHGHDDDVRRVCFSAGGLMITGGQDGTVKVWEAPRGRPPSQKKR
jgi:WD40 repeat protein